MFKCSKKKNFQAFENFLSLKVIFYCLKVRKILDTDFFKFIKFNPFFNNYYARFLPHRAQNVTFLLQSNFEYFRIKKIRLWELLWNKNKAYFAPLESEKA